MNLEFRGKSLSEAIGKAVACDHNYLYDYKRINKESSKFDFLSNVRFGESLFVGEGDFSFSLSIAVQSQFPSNITSTIPQKEKDIDVKTMQNAAYLSDLGCAVFYEIDAVNLEDSFYSNSVDSVIFQFPNVASRLALYSQNPNHIFALRFLKSAKTY